MKESKDKIKKYLAYNGMVSIVCATTKQLAENIREIHDLTPTTTAILGRVATAGVMMGVTEMKEEDESFTIQINGNGPVQTIIAVVTRKKQAPVIKTYIQNPHVELPMRESDGKIDVGGAVGKNGFLNVISKHPMTKTNYSTYVPLVSGEIAEDFTEFFVKSKQKPTAMALGVLIDANGVKASGGYMIQPMPDATDEVIEEIEKAIASANPISQLLDENLSLDEIAQIISGDENIQIIEEQSHPYYECNCSREKFKKGLISLGKEELQKVIEEDEKAEICCQFCNQKYNFSKAELKQIQEKTK